MALETNPPLGPTFPSVHEVKIGTQEFALTDWNKDGHFSAEDKTVTVKNAAGVITEMGAKTFLERFGLNQKNSYSLKWLVSEPKSYLQQLKANENSVTDHKYDVSSAPSFSWRREMCDPELPIATEALCLTVTDEQMLGSFFANAAERRAIGLEYARQAQAEISEFMRLPTIDEKAAAISDAVAFDLESGERNTQIPAVEERITKKINLAVLLLGKEASAVKAAQAELARFQQAAKTTVDIVASRIEDMWSIEGLTDKKQQSCASVANMPLGCSKPHIPMTARKFKLIDDLQYFDRSQTGELTNSYIAEYFLEFQTYYDTQYPADREVFLQLHAKLQDFQKDYPKFYRAFSDSGQLRRLESIDKTISRVASIQVSCIDKGVNDGCPWLDDTITFGPILTPEMLQR